MEKLKDNLILEAKKDKKISFDLSEKILSIINDLSEKMKLKKSQIIRYIIIDYIIKYKNDIERIIKKKIDDILYK